MNLIRIWFKCSRSVEKIVEITDGEKMMPMSIFITASENKTLFETTSFRLVSFVQFIFSYEIVSPGSLPLIMFRSVRSIVSYDNDYSVTLDRNYFFNTANLFARLSRILLERGRSPRRF